MLFDLENSNENIISLYSDNSKNAKLFIQNIFNKLCTLSYYFEIEKEVIDEKLYNRILNIINSNFKYIFFDDILSYLTNKQVECLMNKAHEKDIKVLFYTTEMEYSLFSSYMIIIKEGLIAIEGKTKSVLKEEKLLKKLGYNIPFIAELSNYLKYYDLVSDIFLNEKELVEKLWN